MVSQLVRVAILGMSIDLHARMIESVDFSDQQLREIAERTQQERFSDELNRTLIAERVLGLESYSDPEFLKDSGAALPIANRWLREPLLLAHLETMNAAVDISRQPLPQAMQDLEQWELELSQAEGIAAIMVALTAPSLKAYATALARGAATNDALAVAVAAEQYRRQHGKLPETLEDLVPDFLDRVPEDPFASGSPLRYSVSDGGIAVYSVGADGLDNGGESGDEQGLPPDFVVRIRKVAP
jgi:hypothetical protein